jgi:hypothetical protein
MIVSSCFEMSFPFTDCHPDEGGSEASDLISSTKNCHSKKPFEIVQLYSLSTRVPQLREQLMIVVIQPGSQSLQLLFYSTIQVRGFGPFFVGIVDVN